MALRNDINAQFKSDLINYTSAIDGQAYILLGETVMGDTPARIYYYDANSSASADGENIITATGMGVGRFIKNPIQQANSDWNAVSGMTQILNNPAIGSGTVTSVGITSSDFSVSGSPITNSGNITTNLNTTGINAGDYGIVTVDSKGRATAGKRQETYSG